MIFNSQFLEITPDSSKLSGYLREIEKTVKYYNNQLYEISRKMEKLLKRLEAILETLNDLQTKIQTLEQIYGSRKGNTRGRLSLSFDNEPLLHHKGKTKMVQKPLMTMKK